MALPLRSWPTSSTRSSCRRSSESWRAFQDWFRDIQAWVDFGFAQTPLFDGSDPSAEQWAQIGVSGMIWLVIPMAIGVWAVLRSEVK